MKYLLLSILSIGLISCAHAKKQSSTDVTERSLSSINEGKGKKVKTNTGMLCRSGATAIEATEELSSSLGSQSLGFQQLTADSAGPLWVKGKDLTSVSAVTIIKGPERGFKACVTYQASKARYENE